MIKNIINIFYIDDKNKLQKTEEWEMLWEPRQGNNLHIPQAAHLEPDLCFFLFCLYIFVIILSCHEMYLRMNLHYWRLFGPPVPGSWETWEYAENTLSTRCEHTGARCRIPAACLFLCRAARIPTLLCLQWHLLRVRRSSCLHSPSYCLCRRLTRLQFYIYTFYPYSGSILNNFAVNQFSNQCIPSVNACREGFFL